MDIKEIKVARREMENTIKAAVFGAVETFYINTGLSPQNIHIGLLEITTVGNTERRYVVGDVRADVSL